MSHDDSKESGVLFMQDIIFLNALAKFAMHNLRFEQDSSGSYDSVKQQQEGNTDVAFSTNRATDGSFRAVASHIIYKTRIVRAT